MDSNFYAGYEQASYGGAHDNGYYETTTTSSTGDYYGAVDGYYPSQDEQWGDISEPIMGMTAEHGFFSPLASLQAPFVGDPVSALAYDKTYSAIRVASASKSIGAARYNDHKVSMLVTQSLDDGSVYSSVAGHPEAPAKILNKVYDTIYGSVDASSSQNNSTARPQTAPAHAYRPYYGASDPAVVSTYVKTSYQMGINSLLGLSNGYVASVSPAGVRLHTHGGLQVDDRRVEGMVCGTAHPNSMSTDPTHMTVGGVSIVDENGKGDKSQLLCLDVWQGMRTVASHSIGGYGKASHNNNKITVTALATSHTNGSLVAGCSDGQLRLLDASLRPLATIRSHVGGVSAVSISNDGTLIATTGYGSRAPRTTGSVVYAYPDPLICCYDIRYLGRGGIPHPFAGMRGGPRHVVFLPDVESMPTNRLLVVSGQSGGGMQIIEPFQEAESNSENFILPPLDRDVITAVCMEEDKLALGSSSGHIFQYQLEGYHNSSTVGAVQGGIFVPSATSQGRQVSLSGTAKRASKEKQSLVLPPMRPTKPALSLGPNMLYKGGHDSTRPIFSSYVLCHQPTVSNIGDPSSKHRTSFGDLAASPMVSPSLLHISAAFLEKASPAIDFLRTVATADVGVDLLADHRPDQAKKRVDDRPPLPNANKLVYTSKLFSVVYEESLNRTKKMGRKGRRDDVVEDSEWNNIPKRYRLTLRQSHKAPASFNHCDYNESGFIPGWDYSATMPNAFVPPVLMMMYFIPEVRNIISSTLSPNDPSFGDESNLLPELDFVFSHIDNISRFSMLFSPAVGGTSLTRVGAWAPTNFISCLASLPEAEQLQILDGSPAAVELLRRPEAFYRFLLYHIDKEVALTKLTTDRLDAIAGTSFLNINEFISGSGKPTQSSTRVMTMDLVYDALLDSNVGAVDTATFGAVLQRTLMRETRLRAWSVASKAYETIVQRKMMTSLPKILSLSCACAGRKVEEGLCHWRSGNGTNHFLPEWIEIELIGSGNVIVRELTTNETTGEEYWKESRGAESLPKAISDIVRATLNEVAVRKQRYRLESVLSVVRDDLGGAAPEIIDASVEGTFGHHVVHASIPTWFKIHLLELQCKELEKLIASRDQTNMTILSLDGHYEQLCSRLAAAKAQLDACRESKPGTDWVSINGFVVAKSCVDDARDFRANYKEPSIVVFRAVDEDDSTPKVIHQINNSPMFCELTGSSQIVPSAGDLLAFDAEFVSVGDEESILTETGSKLTIREMRYAMARISVLDCNTRTVILDDHVLPREPVVDYLTRFSGIVAKDLDPKSSPHHLISTRSAYMKLRYLVERGCIFIGHGLQMDFWTANLAVPPNQIIDTVEIYHKPAQRYVSLRFLANFVLKRDMQQDIHDSVEDALAAYQLYATAVQLKASGEFDKLINDLYEFGFKCDWKLGVDSD